MATTINTTAVWTAPVSSETGTSYWTKFLSFASAQQKNQTLWFFLTMVVHGVLVLPVPAVLIYYFNAPMAVLAITMICFFSNLIANMGGAGIKATIAFFLGSLALHILMILVYTL